jgi:hypothetical protein
MKQLHMLGRLIGAAALLFSVSHAALATEVDNSGTLTFSDLAITYNNGISYVAGDADVYNLGNSLSGSLSLSFTGSSYSKTGTALAVIITTDANTALLSSSSQMSALIAALYSATDSTAVNTVLNTYVTGLVGGVYGYNYLPSGGSATTALGETLTAGTTYYAVVVGGTLANSSYTAFTDSSVSYTLGVAAVPEPQAWASMLLGLGLVGGLALRRRHAA